MTSRMIIAFIKRSYYVSYRRFKDNTLHTYTCIQIHIHIHNGVRTKSTMTLV